MNFSLTLQRHPLSTANSGFRATLGGALNSMWKDSETNIDYLNFNYLVEVITELVTDNDITPSTIGVYGDWGSGKSSIMKMVEEKIESQKDKSVIFVHFNGWLFEGYEDAKTALCGAILDAVQEYVTILGKFKGKLKSSITSLKKKIDVNKLLGKGLKYSLDYFLTGGIGILADFTLGSIKDAIKAKANSMSEKQLTELLDLFKSEESKRNEIANFQKEFAKLIEETKVNHMVVFIDELDRCEPDTILDIFAAMRLFLFAKNTSFVIGADERLIRFAIKTKYKEIPENNLDIGKEYLEKMIQYPVNIPVLSNEEIEQYIALMLLEKELKNKEEFNRILTQVRDLKPSEKFGIEHLSSNGKYSEKSKECFDLARQIAISLSGIKMINGNPRQCKRFLNTLYLRMAMANSRGVEYDKNVAAKLMLLEYYKPELYDKVVDPKNKEDFDEIESNKVRDKNVFKADLESSTWFSEWLKIPFKLSNVNIGDYYYFSRKSSRLNMFLKSNLSPTAEKCYDFLKSGNATGRNKAEALLKDVSSEESLSILKLLSDDMNIGEQVDKRIFESFISLIICRQELKIEGLNIVKAIPLQKHDVAFVGKLTPLIDILTAEETSEIGGLYSQNEPLRKAFEAICDLKK